MASRIERTPRSSRCGVWCIGAILFCLVSISCVRAQEIDNGSAMATGTPENETVSTERPDFSVTLNRDESSTDYIAIRWAIPNGYDIDHYVITNQRTSGGSITYSAPLEDEARTYTIEDLARDTEYEVCVRVTFNASNPEGGNEEQDGEAKDTNEPEDQEQHSEDDGADVVVCEPISTVPIMRQDSIIILLCVLGYILLMIIIGYLVWKSHMKKALKKYEESEEEEKIKPDEEPRVYLGSPSANSPSSIEDQDIPYITPPVRDLSPNDRDDYNRALSTLERKKKWWYDS